MNADPGLQPWANTRVAGRLALLLIILLVSGATPRFGRAAGVVRQEPAAEATAERLGESGTDPHVCGLAPLPVQVWEIGLELQATGNCSGITAVFPLPVDWPEQVVRNVGQTVQPPDARLKIDDDRGLVRIAQFRVPRLAAGEIARAVVRVEVERSWQTPPADPEALEFDLNPPKEARPWLLPSPYIESRQRRIIELARGLPVDENARPWNQVESICDWVREHVEYHFDEQIRTLAECLESGRGDCEEMSSLFIALCRARGIPARAVWIPGHTYPEFWLMAPDGTGHWYPCQVAGSRNFGSMPESRPILQKGDRFRLPGNRADQRYAQPTLIVQDADAAPTMKFILRQAGGPEDEQARR